MAATPGSSSPPALVTGLFLPPPFQEKNQGPSRRTPGTPRPPGPSRGGRTPPQQGGRTGMGRGSRSWEDSPGEQPRGGAGGRGRRGRGRGSPHLSGAGDASAADRKSKVGAGRGRRLLAEALHCRSSLFLLSKGPFAHLSILLCLCLSFSPSIGLFLSHLPDQCLCGPSLALSARLPSLPPPLSSLPVTVCLSVSVGLCVSAFSISYVCFLSLSHSLRLFVGTSDVLFFFL